MSSPPIPSKNSSESPGTRESVDTRRTEPRYMLVASADIVDPASETHITGRLSEISRAGCYIDLLNTLPKDTLVQIRISRDQGVFESLARIVYAQEGIGMGVAFVNPSPEQQNILDAWIAELSA
jgi:PilZ domain